MNDPRSRKSRPFRVVAFWMGGLAAVVVAVGLFGYFAFLHYDRVAALHLPEDTVVAVRVDVGQAVFYEPVRKHLLPLLAEAVGQPPDSPELWRGIEEHAGLRRRDLREIVVGWGAGSSDWVLVLNGLFPDGSAVLHRLADALGEEWTMDGERLVDRRSSVTLGQAPDGAIILAPTRDRLEAALAPTERYAELGLALDEGLGAGARGGALLRVAHEVAPEVTTDGAAIERLTVHVTPSEPLGVSVLLYPAPPVDAAGLRPQVDRLVATLKAVVRENPGPDHGGERAALDRARVSEEQSNVSISFGWARAEMDRAAEYLATRLAHRLAESRRGRRPPSRPGLPAPSDAR